MRDLKVVIVDDEVPAQNLLSAFVDGYKGVLRVVQKCANLMDAVEYIKTHPVDIVFLDVEMPVHSGTKIGSFLSREERPDIIYVTAYDNFAIEAIKLGAFDYIVKPIDRTILFECLDRYFLEKEEDKNKEEEKLKITTHQGILLIDYSDILFLSANGSYTDVVLTNKKIVASKPIKFFEQLLPESFVRVHRSYIVNKLNVEALVKKESNWWINFKEGSESVPISRKYKGQVENLV